MFIVVQIYWIFESSFGINHFSQKSFADGGHLGAGSFFISKDSLVSFKPYFPADDFGGPEPGGFEESFFMKVEGGESGPTREQLVDISWESDSFRDKIEDDLLDFLCKGAS